MTSHVPDPGDTSGLTVRRLTTGDEAAARELFELMAHVFDEGSEPLPDSYIAGLLERDSFWALAAFVGGSVVGGLTAHTLPMTRSPSHELMIYDLAVRKDHQRHGVGSALIAELQRLADVPIIRNIFVAADYEDAHALDFYRAQGAIASPVTMFTFQG